VFQTGRLDVAGNAFQRIPGNQPDGTVFLEYTCEGDTVPVQIAVTTSVPNVGKRGDTVTLTTTANADITFNIELYQFVRIDRSYHKIVAIDSVNKNGGNRIYIATIDPYYQSPSLTSDTQAPLVVTNAEYVVFYSDPNNVMGVSESCQNQRSYLTSSITPFDNRDDIRIKIRAISGVISDIADSIVVERSYERYDAVARPEADYAVTEPSNNAITQLKMVGYSWTITFKRQNGNVKPLRCDTQFLKGTDKYPKTWYGGFTVTPSCVVSTQAQGSMIGGVFGLGTTYPHAFEDTPFNYLNHAANVNAYSMPWNIDAYFLQRTLSSISVTLNGASKNIFGTVTATRKAYTPTGQLRWSGGYLWTVRFTERNGNLPTLLTETLRLTNSAPTTSELNIGTQSSLLATDDPGTAVKGNQIYGNYGLKFTDNDAVQYNSTTIFFPVADDGLGGTGQAISGPQFQNYLRTMLGATASNPLVNVIRSTTCNAVMGYRYSIEFIGQTVGGNVPMIKPVLTAAFQSSSIASTPAKIGEVCTDSTKCTVG